MRTLRIAALAMTLASPALAGSKETCTLEAAAHLPRVSGLVVKGSTTRAAPTAVPGASETLLVDVSFAAAGVTDKHTFLCAVTPGGQAIVQRVRQ